ncbi:hypothetical protein [Wuhan house centipede virus 2]|uniref:hypothetical protein n=1 Tax=Wuhan house centipede virus 2 TaxID=1923706 RepID=UPI00090C83AA|nr:hypothetical protein [Wuhan house centipede virus 2]APG76670.1 hypothetical protein [Wuhan house centipede virus 2]APG78460.1 hypothetical protein [Wuhan house centipede virus 2]
MNSSSLKLTNAHGQMRPTSVTSGKRIVRKNSYKTTMTKRNATGYELNYEMAPLERYNYPYQRLYPTMEEFEEEWHDFKRSYTMNNITASNILIYDFDVMENNLPVAHAISSDLQQSSGFARILRNKYFPDIKPIVPKMNRVGTLHFQPVTKQDRVIIGLITKYAYYQKPTYRTVFNALNNLKQCLIVEKFKEIVMPMICCGLDKLDIKYIIPMIKYCLKDLNTIVNISLTREDCKKNNIPIKTDISLDYQPSVQFQLSTQEKFLGSLMLSPKVDNTEISIQSNDSDDDNVEIIIKPNIKREVDEIIESLKQESKWVTDIPSDDNNIVVEQEMSFESISEKLTYAQVAAPIAPKPITLETPKVLFPGGYVREISGWRIARVANYKPIIKKNKKSNFNTIKIVKENNLNIKSKVKCLQNNNTPKIGKQSWYTIIKYKTIKPYINTSKPSFEPFNFGNPTGYFVSRGGFSGQLGCKYKNFIEPYRFELINEKLNSLFQNLKIKNYTNITQIPSELKKNLFSIIIKQLNLNESVFKPIMVVNMVNCILTIICNCVVLSRITDKVALGACICTIVSNIVVLLVDLLTYFSMNKIEESLIEKTAHQLTTESINELFKEQGMSLIMSPESLQAFKLVDIKNKSTLIQYIDTFQVKIDETQELTPLATDMIENYEEYLNIAKSRIESHKNQIGFKFIEQLNDAKSNDFKTVIDKVIRTSSRGNMCLLHSTLGKLNTADVLEFNDKNLLAEFMRSNSKLYAVEIYMQAYAERKKSTLLSFDELCNIWLNDSTMLEMDFCAVIAEYLGTTIDCEYNNKHYEYKPINKQNDDIIHIVLENQHFSRKEYEITAICAPIRTACECTVKFFRSLAAQYPAGTTRDTYLGVAALIIYTYNSKVLIQNLRIKGINNLDVKSIIGIVIDVISTLAFTIGLATTKGDFGDRLIKAEKISTSSEKIGNTITDRVENITQRIFNVYMSSDGETTHRLIEDLNRLEEFNKIDEITYVNDLGLLNECLEYMSSVKKRMMSLNLKGKDVNVGLSNTQNNVKKVIDKLQSKIESIQRLLKINAVRQEPVGIFMFGLKGAGKTTAVTTAVIPVLARKLKLRPGIYPAALDNNHWNPYRNESFTIIDELFVEGAEDPYIPKLHKMLSSFAVNMPGAHLDFKESYFTSQFLFAMANIAYQQTKLSKPAEEALYGRFTGVQFVNLKQTPEQSRFKVEHIDVNDPTTYEVRVFDDQINPQFHGLEEDITPTIGKDEHFINGEYDDHLYSVRNHKYRLMTFDQFSDLLISYYVKHKDAYQIGRKKNLKAELDYLATTTTDPDSVTQILKTKGYFDSEIAETLNIKNLVIEQDNFVISFFGDTGTGKTTFANNLALEIQTFLNYKIYTILDEEDMSKLTYDFPAIYVFHDSIYDEQRYINVYDKIKKPSIIITTSNHKIRWVTRGMRELQFNDDGAADSVPEVNDGLFGYYQTKVSQIVSLLTKSDKRAGWEIDTLPGYHPQPGYARRLGLVTGLHRVGDKFVYSQRPDGSSITVESTTGYRYIVDKEVVNVHHVAKRTILQFTKLQQLFEPKMVKIQPAEMQAKISQVLNPDVIIKAPTIEELVDLTNCKEELVRAVLCPYINPFGSASKKQVVVSPRVIKSNYSFNPLDFAIPRNIRLEEAVSVACKSYRLLMNANSSFTTLVECKEFVALGTEGTIWYTCDPYDVITYQHEFRNDTIVYQKKITKDDGSTVIEDVKTISVDDIIMLFCANKGISELLENYDYDLSRYIMKTRAEIETKYSDKFAKVESQTIIYSNSMREKMAFFVIWSEFKKTVWYKLGMALLGLCVGYFIIQLVSALWKFFTGFSKEHTGVIHHKTNKDAWLMYILDKFDKNQNKAFITIFSVDNNLDSFSKRDLDLLIKEDIKDNINELLDDNESDTINCENVEWNDVNIKSDWSKKKIETVLPQSLHRLYRINVKSMKTEKSVAVQKQAMKTLGTVNVPRNTNIKGYVYDRHILEHIYNSMGVCTASFGTQQAMVRGIAICENYILCPRHNLRPNATYTFEWFRERNGRPKVVNCEHVLDEDVHDLAILKITDSGVPYSRNILKYFIDDNLSRIANVFLPTMRLESNSIEKVSGTAVHIPLSVPIKKDNVDMPSGTVVAVASLLDTNIVLPYGECGTPIIDRDTCRIAGIMFGDSADGHTIVGSIITKTMLSQCLAYLRGTTGDVNVKSSAVSILEECELIDDCLTRQEIEEYKIKNLEYIEEVEPEFHDAVCGEEEEQWYDSLSDVTLLNVKFPDQDEFIIMPNECAEYITSAEVPRDPYPALDGTYTKCLGYQYKSQKSIMLKDKYIRTPFANLIREQFPQIPDDCANSMLDSTKVEDPSALVTSVSGKPSILLSQISKINDPINAEMQAIGESCLDIARVQISERYVELYSKYDHKFLSKKEMINGLVDETNNLYGNLEAVNQDASSGIWTTLQGKRSVQNLKSILEPAGINNYNKQPLYTLKTNDLGNAISRHISQQKNAWRHGVRYEGIVKDNLKVELRPLDKVKKGKTRCFESFDVFTLLNFRALFGTIQAAMKVERAKGSCQIGLSTDRFTQIYFRLSRVSPFATHGDFEAWDKHMFWQAAEAAVRVWSRMLWSSDHFLNWNLKQKYSFKNEDELTLMLTTAMRANIRAVSIADGYLLSKSRGNCSGIGCTTTLNSTVNELLLRSCIIFLIQRHNATYNVLTQRGESMYEYYAKELGSILTPAQLTFVLGSKFISSRISIDAKFIESNIDNITYGDDIGISISQDLLFIINFVSLKYAYDKLFGINFDSPYKDGSVVPYIRTDELDFVSRAFHYEEQVRILFPRLKQTSIWRLLFWVTSDTYPQYEMNLTAMAQELFLHDEKEYKLFVKVIKTIINPYLYSKYNLKYKIPNFSIGREEFINNSRQLVATVDVTVAGNIQTQIESLLSNLRIKNLLEKLTKDTLLNMSYTPAQLREFTQQLAMGLPLKLSGTPAYLVTPKNALWSISYEPTDQSSYLEIRKLLQSACAKTSGKAIFIDLAHVTICMNDAWVPRYQLQARLVDFGPPEPANEIVQAFKSGCSELYQLLVDDLKIKSLVANVDFGRLNTDIMDIRIKSKQVTVRNSVATTINAVTEPDVPGTALPAAVKMPPGRPEMLLGSMLYHHQNPTMYSHRLQVVKQIVIPSTVTAGTVLFHISLGDLIRQDMVSATKDCNEFTGSIMAVIECLANPTIGGAAVIGLLPPGYNASSATEASISEYDRVVLNMSESQKFSVNLRPYEQGLGSNPNAAISARMAWLEFNTTTGVYTIPAQTLAKYPTIVGIARNDWVSINGSAKSTISLTISSAFGQDFCCYSGVPQITGATLTDSAWVGSKTKLGTLRSVPLVELGISGSSRLILDGNYIAKRNIDVIRETGIAILSYLFNYNPSTVGTFIGRTCGIASGISASTEQLFLQGDNGIYKVGGEFELVMLGTDSILQTIIITIEGDINVHIDQQTNSNLNHNSRLTGLLTMTYYVDGNQPRIQKVTWQPAVTDQHAGDIAAKPDLNVCLYTYLGEDQGTVVSNGPILPAYADPLPADCINLLVQRDGVKVPSAVVDTTGPLYATLLGYDSFAAYLRSAYGETALAVNLIETVRGTTLGTIVYDPANRSTFMPISGLIGSDAYAVSKYTASDLAINNVRFLDSTGAYPYRPLDGFATRAVTSTTNTTLYDKYLGADIINSIVIKGNAIVGAIGQGLSSYSNYEQQQQWQQFEKDQQEAQRDWQAKQNQNNLDFQREQLQQQNEIAANANQNRLDAIEDRGIQDRETRAFDFTLRTGMTPSEFYGATQNSPQDSMRGNTAPRATNPWQPNPAWMSDNTKLIDDDTGSVFGQHETDTEQLPSYDSSEAVNSHVDGPKGPPKELPNTSMPEGSARFMENSSMAGPTEVDEIPELPAEVTDVVGEDAAEGAMALL